MVDRVYERNTSDSAPQPPADPSVGYPTGGNPAQGVPATIPGPYWYHMITESLRRVVVEAGLMPDHEDLDQLLGAIKSSGQFADYSEGRTYETGETCRGSDGHFYEFYDRDQDGTVVGLDPTDPLNRPHIWMRWDGVRPATVIEWRSETLPEGYIVNDGDDYSRADYRRIFAAWGTTYGAGDGSTTFGSPDDRGEFKRGLDQGRGVDANRLLTAYQGDAIRNITGGIDAVVDWLSGTGAFVRGNKSSDRQSYGGVAGETYFHGINFDASRVVPTASENRPRNNAVIWLTKI